MSFFGGGSLTEQELTPIAARPTATPLPVALLFEQTRQVFGTGKQTEYRELGQRLRVDACRGAERDPCQLVTAQVRGLDLAAAAGGHRVHPAEVAIRISGPAQGCRILVGNPVERVG